MRVLVLGAALVAVGVVVGGLPIVRALTALSLLVVGFRRTASVEPRVARPWRIILTGGALALVSAAVRLVHGLLIGVDYAYPSPADAIAYVAYGVMIAGAVSFVRARTIERYRSDMVDSIVVATFAAVLVYAFVLGTYLADETIPVFDRVGNGLYSAMTIALIGAVARVSFGPGERNGSYYLFAAAAILIVVNDVLLLLDTVGRPGVFQAASVVAPMAFVFATASIAHPGAFRLTDRPVYREDGLGIRRILMLLIALATAPLISQLEIVRADNRHLVVVSCLWVVIAFAVLYRMVLIVSDRERATRQERRLRDVAAQLTTLHDGEAITSACLDAGLNLVGGEAQARISLYASTPEGWRAEAVRGLSAASIEGLVLGGDRADMLDEATLTHTSVTGEMVPSPESAILPGLGEASVFVVVTPVPSRHDRSACLVVVSSTLVRREQVAAIGSLAGQLSLALDGVELAEQIHQRRSNRRFRALVENSSDVVLVLDDDSCIAFASPTVRRLLGREEADVVGRPALTLVHRPDQIQLRRLLAAPSRPQRSGRTTAEVRLIHGDGELRWFEIEARDLTNEDEVRGIVLTASDISDRKRAEAQLLRSEARFRLMVQNSSDVVGIMDEDGMITYISPSIERMLGFPPAEVLGRNVFELLSVTEAERLRGAAIEELDGSSLEVRVQGATGVVHALEVGITDMRDQAAVDGIVLNIRDVTDRKSLEDDLRHQALHDDLTGLANRVMFRERVADALRHRDPASLVAVLFVDLDDFKLINDTLGHVAGDQVLVSLSHRISQCLRLSDLAARLGGDEFAVLLSGVYGESEVVEIVERIQREIAEQITVGGRPLKITASVGIAIAAIDRQTTADDLLRSADVAMYRAKQDGKNRHEMFADEMQASALEELELKSSLVRAVDNDEFVLHYQPIVDMGSGRIRGVEALIRWEDPTRGMVSPAAFIPLAEETGLIVPIGLWVAEQASRDLAAWRAAGHDLYVSINVSGRQMDADDFVQEITSRVLRSSVDPSNVVVELTESMLADSTTTDVFRRLRRRGFRIALDDFGTGYSALQYLQSFDIDLIKIDRSFVKAMGETGNTGVVQAVLDVARNVGASTVAEGIEDTGEQRMLRELGVELGQGYYFSKPVPADRIASLLDEERGLVTVD